LSTKKIDYKNSEKKILKIIKYSQIIKTDEEDLKLLINKFTKVSFDNKEDVNEFIEIFKKNLIYFENNIFGIKLEEVMKRSNETTHLIPKILIEMINYLYKKSPSQKG
jgi:hypothetical protein